MRIHLWALPYGQPGACTLGKLLLRLRSRRSILVTPFARPKVLPGATQRKFEPKAFQRSLNGTTKRLQKVGPPSGAWVALGPLASRVIDLQVDDPARVSAC